jgi:hypothetical protein
MAKIWQVKGFWFQTGGGSGSEKTYELPPHWEAINVERLAGDNSIIVWAKRNGNT